MTALPRKHTTAKLLGACHQSRPGLPPGRITRRDSATRRTGAIFSPAVFSMAVAVGPSSDGPVSSYPGCGNPAAPPPFVDYHRFVAVPSRNYEDRNHA